MDLNPLVDQLTLQTLLDRLSPAQQHALRQQALRQGCSVLELCTDAIMQKAKAVCEAEAKGRKRKPELVGA